MRPRTCSVALAPRCEAARESDGKGGAGNLHRLHLPSLLRPRSADLLAHPPSVPPLPKLVLQSPLSFYISPIAAVSHVFTLFMCSSRCLLSGRLYRPSCYHPSLDCSLFATPRIRFLLAHLSPSPAPQPRSRPRTRSVVFAPPCDPARDSDGKGGAGNLHRLHLPSLLRPRSADLLAHPPSVPPLPKLVLQSPLSFYISPIAAVSHVFTLFMCSSRCLLSGRLYRPSCYHPSLDCSLFATPRIRFLLAHLSPSPAPQPRSRPRTRSVVFAPPCDPARDSDGKGGAGNLHWFHHPPKHRGLLGDRPAFMDPDSPSSLAISAR